MKDKSIPIEVAYQHNVTDKLKVTTAFGTDNIASLGWNYDLNASSSLNGKMNYYLGNNHKMMEVNFGLNLII